MPARLHTYRPTDLRAYISTCLHTYPPTYPPTYLPTYRHKCLHTYLHTYLNDPTCIHAYMHAYIHKCVYTYIHKDGYIHTSRQLCKYMHRSYIYIKFLFIYYFIYLLFRYKKISVYMCIYIFFTREDKCTVNCT